MLSSLDFLPQLKKEAQPWFEELDPLPSSGIGGGSSPDGSCDCAVAMAPAGNAPP